MPVVGTKILLIAPKDLRALATAAPTIAGGCNIHHRSPPIDRAKTKAKIAPKTEISTKIISFDPSLSIYKQSLSDKSLNLKSKSLLLMLAYENLKIQTSR